MPTIEVNVVGCRNIPGEWTETTDPYVLLKYNGDKKKTRTDKQGGKNPNFNDTLTFEVESEPYVFEVEIWDNDMLRDDKLAHGIVEFRDCVEQGSLSGTFPLRAGMFDGHSGDVILEMRMV